MDRSIEKELWSIGIHEEILTPHLRDLFLQGEYKALVKQVLEADNIDISIGHLLTTIFYNGLGTRSEVGIAARIWQEIEGWHGSRRLSEYLMQRMALAFDLRYDG